MTREAIRDWSAILAIFTAIGVLIYGWNAEYGWFETAFFWPVHLLGLTLVAVSIAKGAPRLLAIITPVFLIPLGMGAMLLYACSQGDCL